MTALPQTVPGGLGVMIAGVPFSAVLTAVMFLRCIAQVGPLLLIFTGVVGGLVSLGLIGIFVGPVLLAVTYTLLNEWLVPASDMPPGESA